MVEWITTEGLTDYQEAVDFMEARASAIAAGEAEECIWLVEHPPYLSHAVQPRMRLPAGRRTSTSDE